MRKSVWIVGGDGWAYDIGYGGLDHVLASGRNVKVLVLDTEVYSNTGGQMSKATPRGAVAKFAAGGKPAPKKDLGLIAMTYGNIYVASVAMGAKDEHTLKAFLEAEAYNGPALIIAYCHCIAHGINMTTAMQNQKAAVQSGQWLLYRYNPDLSRAGQNPLHLDSSPPKLPIEQYLALENRFRMLSPSQPEVARRLFAASPDRCQLAVGTLPIPCGPEWGRETSVLENRGENMNLSTTYLGLKLRTPLVPSASPLSENLDNIKRMEDAGASAIVLHSLFEEQMRHESHTLHYHLTHGTESYPEALTYFPEPEEFRFGPDLYLRNIVKAKEEVGVPIIASLNGSTFGGWTTFAEQIEQAGADALELNIYSIPTDPELIFRGDRNELPHDRRFGESTGENPDRRKAQPVLHQFRKVCAPTRQARRRWARAFQPFLSAGHRSGDARGHARRPPEHTDGHAPAATLDRDPARPNPRQPRGHQRHPSRHGRA